MSSYLTVEEMQNLSGLGVLSNIYPEIKVKGLNSPFESRGGEMNLCVDLSTAEEMRVLKAKYSGFREVPLRNEGKNASNSSSLFRYAMIRVCGLRSRK